MATDYRTPLEWMTRCVLDNPLGTMEGHAVDFSWGLTRCLVKEMIQKIN
jgi:hypothetical protein